MSMHAHISCMFWKESQCNQLHETKLARENLMFIQHIGLAQILLDKTKNFFHCLLSGRGL
jgi:hypothetical protein